MSLDTIASCIEHVFVRNPDNEIHDLNGKSIFSYCSENGGQCSHGDVVEVFHEDVSFTFDDGSMIVIQFDYGEPVNWSVKSS